MDITEVTVMVPVTIGCAPIKRVPNRKVLKSMAATVLRERVRLLARSGEVLDASRKLTYSVDLELHDRLREIS